MILRRSRQADLEAPYSFQDRFKNIQRIAIIYPEQQKWLRIASYALQRMYNLPEQFEFLLMVPPTKDHTAISAKHEYGDMLYSPNSEDRIKLRSRLATFNPDILLQLEPDPDERLIKLIKKLNIALRIGFGPEESGLNIIYSQKQSGFYEKNILNLIALIEAK